MDKIFFIIFSGLGFMVLLSLYMLVVVI